MTQPELGPLATFKRLLLDLYGGGHMSPRCPRCGAAVDAGFEHLQGCPHR